MGISMDTMPQLVRDFATYKLTIQGCSRKTVDEYVSDLRLFVRYLYGKRCGIKIPSEAYEKIDISGLKTDFFEAITTDEIYDFFVYLSNERGNSASAKSRKLSAIKAFFKYACQKRRILDYNP